MPRILFLDEPTSGLDSATSKEVISSIARTCKAQGTIVIATIHQPSWDTLLLFDKLLILSHGLTVYSGRTENLVDWLASASIGRPVEEHRNPADAAIELINDDFSSSITSKASSTSNLSRQSRLPRSSTDNTAVPSTDPQGEEGTKEGAEQLDGENWKEGGVIEAVRKTWILMERNAVNYSRSLLSYGIRLGMYIGLGVLLATIWVHLGDAATTINDRLSIFFFSIAFLSFMSVAGIPSFLEERAVFIRERNNGLYSSFQYALANSLINLPFLFMCSLAFMLIMYWGVGLHSGAVYFWRFTAFLFLAIYAAESQCLLIAAFLPIFVAALALAAFANGFWMCVQGYFIRAVNLPRFWYYWAHWIDYETFAFNMIAKSDLTGLRFPCTGDIAVGTCQCPYTSSLIAQGDCAVTGEDVLKELQIDGTNYKLYGFMMVIIIIVYRTLFWAGLAMRKK